MKRSFRGSHSENGGLPIRAEITVTSLVDVAFTLLIIFMITAPILQGGVEIAVPRAPAAPLQTPEGVVISIDEDGTVFLDDTEVSPEEFDATVVDVIRRQGSPTVYVKGHQDVRYEAVLRVIGRLQEAEIETVSLVAQPETERRSP